ncbi:hypothetical protein [Desulfomonile tiedjei]|uniref:hypothetical protein n=1 Tax=Desulfomonile tiedjei TaxID=2358 RepID=UPI0002E42225|nr:hypothetical protein [Desulfomonile tiedjei]
MTPRYVDDLISKYANKRVLIDTNLLLLYFIGEFDIAQIGRFKRVKQFTTKDFDLIKKLLTFFKQRITTPNIMTEVSNLAGQLPGASNSDFRKQLGEQIAILTEEYSPA